MPIIKLPKLLTLDAVALVALACLLAGWKLRDADYQRHLKKDAVETIKVIAAARRIEAAGVEIAHRASTAYAEGRTKIETRTRTIIERIPYYVTRQADASCTLPIGLIRLHNEAATASGGDTPLPSTPGFNPDAPSGVALSEYGGVVAGNYGKFHLLQSEVTVWRKWYEDAAKAWEEGRLGKGDK